MYAMHCLHACLILMDARRGQQVSRSGVSDGCELSCECLELYSTRAPSALESRTISSFIF